MCFVFETLASAQFSMCSEHWRKQLQKLKRYCTRNFQCKMCRLISMGCIENGALASVSVSGAACAKVSDTLKIRPWQTFRPLQWLSLKIHDSLGYRFMIVAFSFFFCCCHSWYYTNFPFLYWLLPTLAWHCFASGNIREPELPLGLLRGRGNLVP